MSEQYEWIVTPRAKTSKRGLWDNINAKKKRGEAPAKPGDEDYPEESALKAAQRSSKKKAEKTSKRGLWANIHAKRKRGEEPAKPGDDDYPEPSALRAAQQSSKKKDKKKESGEKKKKKKDPRLERAGVSGYNKPKRTPNHPTKSHVVVAKTDGKVKTIRFGEQGAKTNRSAKQRKSFKSRHRKNINKGPSSAAYWANKVKWKESQISLGVLEDIIKESEAWAKSALKEAADVYKMSASQDAEMPELIERFLGEITNLCTAPGVANAELMGLVDKHSSAPHVFQEYHAEVVLPAQYAAQYAEQRTKQSFLGDIFSGMDPETKARQQAASMGGGFAPARSGAFSFRDPVFDVTRGLRKVDEASNAALRFAGLTPQQRAASGVFFESDLPTLAREFRPQPRSLREAVLLGTQQGVRRANMRDPSLIERMKYDIARRNAQRLAFKAQTNRLHGSYPGLLGTLEASVPTTKDKIRDFATGIGQKYHNLSPAVKAGIGGVGLLGSAIALQEYRRDREAKRRRIGSAKQVARAAAEKKEDSE